MNITQTFYDHLAPQYDRLFSDWQAATREQAMMLEKLLAEHGYGKAARILDCACGIGTQAIGLAALGYCVTGSDLSEGALRQAKERAKNAHVEIRFEQADFCRLSETFSERFDVIIAMDNALPHMMTSTALEKAVNSITDRLADGAMFVASIRDYDALLETKPPYSPPYIHETAHGKRVSFQTWKWDGDRYNLTQYIIEDEDALQVSKFECSYRATRREELTELLTACGCREVRWLFPDETGFYQPIIIAKK